MKLYIYILIALFSSLLLIPQVNAGTEEEECFKILHKYTSKYNNLFDDMSSIIIDSNETDLSDYEYGFRENTITQNGFNPYFRAKRNNIGTIQAENTYLMTQVVPFGIELKNMEFPLQIRTASGKLVRSEGEPYTRFAQNMIYTHHLSSFPHQFSSCSYLVLNPVESGNYDSISTKYWFVNGVKQSGGAFELLHEGATADKILGTSNNSGNRFLVGKTRVPALDMQKKELFTMDIIIVAFDNSSSLFNEYETFPLSVEAMTDMDALAGKEIGDYSPEKLQEHFISLVQEKTCLSVPIGKKKELSEGCNGDFQPYFSKDIAKSSLLDRVISVFIPSANAALSPEEVSQHFGTGELNELETRGALIKGSVPFYLVKKLRKVPDETFQNFILSSVANGTHDFLMAYSGSEEYKDYARVFSECGISYNERKDIVIDYLTNLDPKTWNKNNLTYSDPRFGDCVIPYPDKRHLAKVIPGSFEINQYRAKQLMNQTMTGVNYTPKNPNYTEKQIKNIRKINSLYADYNDKISRLNERYNAGDYSDEEYQKQLNVLIDERTKKIDAIQSRNFSFSPTLIIGGALIFIGIILLVFLLRRKKS